MLRTSFGAFLLGLAVAACGGGNNNATHSCGDGHVDADEECDDGNSTSNDGCSAVCKIETSHCGDGITEVATEQCDDGNNVSGDGCSATCQRETVPPMNCGNGVIDTGETCDDHNLASGDGCSATCAVETGYVCTGTPSMCTIPPMATGGTCDMPMDVPLAGTTTLTGTATGDTTIGTSMVPAADCIGFDDDGIGTDNIWSFTLASAMDVTIVLTPSIDFDPAIRLLTTPCDPTTAVVSPANALGCEDQGYSGDPERLAYTHLPAATYYVVVDSYDTTSVGPYSFTITASPSMCGNGIVDGGEACDDHNTATGDGCDGSCYVEPGWDCGSASPSVCVHTCGNGLIDPGEECDGGPTGTTHCTTACLLNSDVAEVEPNDTAATAQHLNAVAHQIIKGTLEDGDVDLYTFTLTAPKTVEIETYDTVEAEFTPSDTVSTLTDLQCYADDTELRIFTSTGDPTDDTTATIWDDQDGTSNCSYVGPHDSDDANVDGGADVADIHQGMLPAGTYTLKVNDYFGFSEDRYLIDLRIE